MAQTTEDSFLLIESFHEPSAATTIASEIRPATTTNPKLKAIPTNNMCDCS